MKYGGKKEKFLKLFSNEIFEDYKLLGQVDKKRYKIKHLKCGTIFTPGYLNFLNGSRCPNKNCISEKIKNTFKKKYNVEHPMQIQETRDKIKKTLMNKYGVEHPMQIQELKDKIKETNIKRYGTTNVMQNEEIKNRMIDTNLKKYGVKSTLELNEVQNKIKKTNFEQYGAENPFASEYIKDKIKETLIKKYGCEYITQNKEIRDKIKETNLEKYGVTHPLQNDVVLKKVKKTNLKRYGCENVSNDYNINEKRKNIFLNKYGFISPLKNKKVQEKIEQTNLKKYGVKNYTSSDAYKEQKRKDFFYKVIQKYDDITPLFNIEEYCGVKIGKYKWLCNKCKKEFKDTLNSGHIPACPFCKGKFKSKIENNIKEWLLKHSSIEPNVRYYYHRSHFHELDILVEKNNIGIELNGIYWHSEISGKKDKNYHINKTNFFDKKGIQTLHIFDIEWIYKQDIVKSMILSKLNLLKNKIYARKCKIKEINSSEASDFYDSNHLQGSINSSINIGLFYNDELVSCLSFAKPRFNKKYEYEITRFASKTYTSVTGAFGKLLNYFMNKSQPQSIITYADLRYSTGNLYLKNGFKLIDSSKPNYFYTKDYKNLESRIKYQKHKLKNIFENYDEQFTEWENMQINGYDRIWDCGNLVFEYIK